MEYKGKEVVRLEKLVRELTSDLQGIQKELDAILEPLKRLFRAS